MTDSLDALVVGAGPAGTSVAIWLASAGWQVALVEQHRYPRRKVCGECVAAGNLTLLDKLGIGETFQRFAGPELRRVAWMSGEATSIAEFPACNEGPYSFGRALGRDRLDEMLLRRAQAIGVLVLQPAKVRAIQGAAAGYACTIASMPERGPRATMRTRTLHARVVVDAHGSWEPGPRQSSDNRASSQWPRGVSDLFAFKATYQDTALEPGLLPVVALKGGYGGMVVADGGRTTLACCLRREMLRTCRIGTPGASAGEAVETYLRRSCRGIREALKGAHRVGTWLSVGPIRPGIRIDDAHGLFRVGNAAGESHPLIGEGISMALQSAALLAHNLTQQPPAAIDTVRARYLQQSYASAWREQFSARLRLAAVYAQFAMHPALEMPTRAMLRRWPGLLSTAARLAGKTRGAVPLSILYKEAL